MPTLATHLERRSAAMGVDWEQVYGGQVLELERSPGVT